MNLARQTQQLIDQFVADLPGKSPAAVDLGLFKSAALKDVFLRSVILVALADGAVSSEEMAVIKRYAGQLSIDDKALYRLIHETAVAMLSQFEGVTIFQDQVMEIGRDLGLSEAQILEVVGG